MTGAGFACDLQAVSRMGRGQSRLTGWRKVSQEKKRKGEIRGVKTGEEEKRVGERRERNKGGRQGREIPHTAQQEGDYHAGTTMVYARKGSEFLFFFLLVTIHR